MLEVDQALQQVLAHTKRKTPVRVPLAESLGLALAEDVTSDVDSPPHDKSMVDGYAVVAADLQSGVAELQVLEEVTAGAVPQKTVTTGHCTRIMTGAPLPEGADAVAMVEYSRLLSDGSQVHIDAPTRPGQNIMRRAASLRQGEIVLSAGHVIRPPEFGLMSQVGRTNVTAVPRPNVAILSTGNELVEAGILPAAGQIRNSNGPLLVSAARRARGVPTDLGIARDDRESLRAKIETGLSFDVLVLSGGVSAGVLDLVPGVLQELGVEQVFHKVNLKPGKPIWFGVFRGKSSPADGRLPSQPTNTDNERGTLVFGVPGNPVSSFVGVVLFVRPAIALLSGRDDQDGLRRLPARLGCEFAHRGDRPTYFPAMVRREADALVAHPVRWQGSADLRGLCTANALVPFPAGDKTWPKGDVFDVIMI
jgi:molybdopterin molybdotransferase